MSDIHTSIRYLQSLITDPEGKRYFVTKTPDRRLREFKEQLARTADFLSFAGQPQHQYRTIHVAGTSGKSSVTTILAAILTHCGFRTGHHVSPYLQTPNEKLIVNGKMITDAAFARLVDRFRELHQAWGASRSPQPRLRYGEAWVALTYLWFAMQRVDWAVIETGVGGRYDPTNVLDPHIAVITNIHYDHTNILGDTLPQIAAHKAGIIQPNRPALTAETKPAALQVIQAEAARQNAPLYVLGRDFDYTIHRTTPHGSTFTVHAPHHIYPDLHIPLLGRFQPLNAAVAIAALDVLERARDTLHTAHNRLTPEALRAALAGVRFPGRLEIVRRQPTVILDGAHNPHKMRSLASSLRQLFPARRFTVLFGSLLIKDAAAMLRALLPLAGRFIFAPNPVYGKPGMTPQALAAALHRLAPDVPVELADSVQDGIQRGLAALPPDGHLLITGSIYFVGAARAVVGKR